MKGLGLAICLWAAVAGAAAAGPAEDELTALERQRSAAILAHDMAFLDALYLDDFQGMTATGFKVDKPTLMQVFRRDDPDTIFTIDQIEPRIFGDVAVTTLRLTGRDRSGAVLAQQRLLHVYVKRDGRWRMKLGQGTLIPPERREP